ncbi:hypothetical protein SASPL_139318 [Salvia splendens]|uniref:Serine-threonine/tyrosine-protein kinase catalytic domain-containing protein n=1 Tax=Salvia splendens TaxID=180675 RepID=A0A8X8WMQ2_SALSN|nr:hypothetical protein SASPL_139318 [Salvia splendens]
MVQWSIGSIIFHTDLDIATHFQKLVCQLKWKHQGELVEKEAGALSSRVNRSFIYTKLLTDLKGLDLRTGKFIRAFDPANKIGEGLKQLSSKSKQGNREFINEIGMISALQHPHLVKLYGCCIEGNQLLLVYEYQENNSLARALFAGWDEEDNTHISTRIAGTFGYMAPEYAMRGYLTDTAHVYSFGIVVLEIVSGRSNSSIRPKEDSFYLLDWVPTGSPEPQLHLDSAISDGYPVFLKINERKENLIYALASRVEGWRRWWCTLASEGVRMAEMVVRAGVRGWKDSGDGGAHWRPRVEGWRRWWCALASEGGRMAESLVSLEWKDGGARRITVY